MAIGGRHEASPASRFYPQTCCSSPPYNNNNKPHQIHQLFSSTFSLTFPATARASVLHHFGRISSRKTRAPLEVRLATLFARPCDCTEQSTYSTCLTLTAFLDLTVPLILPVYSASYSFYFLIPSDHQSFSSSASNSPRLPPISLDHNGL